MIGNVGNAVRFTDHYNDERWDDRKITLDQAMWVVNNPVRTQMQSDGRIRYWAYLDEFRHYVRVVVEIDSETIVTAFIDSRFRP